MRRRKKRFVRLPGTKRLGLFVASFFLAWIFVALQAVAAPEPMKFKNLDTAPPVKLKSLDPAPPAPTELKIIKHPSAPGQVKPNTMKVNKLQPIQFKAFSIQELRHPKSHPVKAGTLIAPDEEITLKSGKKIKGRDLLDEINKLEKEYNAYGYSLRRPVKTPIVINETIMKRDLLQTQQRNSMAKYRDPQARLKAPKFASMQTMHTQRVNQMPSIIQNLNKIQPSVATALPKPINEERSYDDSWGDRDYFAVGLHGKVGLNADKDNTKVFAEGWSTATVFDHDWKVVSIQGGAEAPTTNANGPVRAYLKVTALGDDLFTPIDVRATGSLYKEDDQHIGVDESIKIPVVALGPFSVNVTLGFRGKAGIRYGVYLSPGSAQAKFMPYLETSAYGQAGLNVWLLVDFEAGVGATLTLLNDYLDLSATAGISFDQPQPRFFYAYSGVNSINALSGDVYVYLTIDYYIDSDTWKWNVFSWDGFSNDAYVIGPVSYGIPIVPGEDPAAWKVTVYQHANYGGKHREYTIYPGQCQAMEVNFKNVDMNDKLSSAKVGEKVRLLLFQHVRYSGGSLVCNSSVTNLKQQKFNDITSSLIVYPKSMAYPLGVYLIGNKTSFYPFIGCRTGVWGYPHVVYNDDAKKVRIPATDTQPPPWGNIVVQIWQHADYKGQSVTYTAGPSGGEFVLPKGLSGKASSLKISVNVSDPKRLERPF